MNETEPERHPAPGALAAPGQKVGSYTLAEKLGAGGLGEVWKARDARLNRVVALKFITGEHATSRELLREARAASALNHPNIVTIFEVGESEGRTYLAMELIEGETLRARMKRAPVPLEEALDIANQMATGLAAAHRQGIVHRDLKPENIMLRADGYVKILDFGLAKVLPWSETADSTIGSVPTRSGHLVGTFTYMSPEQARGLPVSPASDVFSFGIVLYELLTGEHPFRAKTALDTLTAILHKEPEPISEKAAPSEISVVVTEALHKDQSRRFPSAVELADRVRRAREAGSAPVPGPSAVRHQPRWLQWIGVALLGILLLLAAWYLWSPLARSRGAPALQSVAVMTFRTDVEDTRAAPLAQGLPEAVSGALSRSGLRVVSRSSVLGLTGAVDSRNAGAQLGVDAVIEGSVRSYGPRFKIYIELVNTRSGFQIWSATLTAEGEDLLGSEQKTAAEIARQLREALAGPRGP